ncbi:hypothetical protein [Neomoorella thermoacetica]
MTPRNFGLTVAAAVNRGLQKGKELARQAARRGRMQAISSLENC